MIASISISQRTGQFSISTSPLSNLNLTHWIRQTVYKLKNIFKLIPYCNHCHEYKTLPVRKNHPTCVPFIQRETFNRNQLSFLILITNRIANLFSRVVQEIFPIERNLIKSPKLFRAWVHNAKEYFVLRHTHVNISNNVYFAATRISSGLIKSNV